MDQLDQKVLREQIDKLKIEKIKRKYYNGKMQARHRGQRWDIPRDWYIQLWLTDNRWMHSGQSSDNLNLSRKDMNGDWTVDNVHIVSRSEMLKNEGRHRKISNAKAKKN